MSPSAVPGAVDRALVRAEKRLARAKSVEAVLARREADAARPDDDELAAALAAGLHRTQAADGSWGFDLLQTAEALIELDELAVGGTGPNGRGDGDTIERGLAWLRTRQGAPGRFGDGCTPVRHRLALCHHFLAGFFAPTVSDEPIDELPLPCGATVAGDADARLAASSVALRAMLRWAPPGPDARLHLDGLRRIVGLWTRWDDERFSPPAVLAALATLLNAAGGPATDDSPAEDALDPVVAHGVALAAGAQRADGSWPDADAFQVLEVLQAAAQQGYRTDALDAAMYRGAGLLAVSQQPDGSWGREAIPRRTLIGWRALHYATEHARPRAGSST